MKKDCFVIGVDYGTDSVRSIIVDTNNGNEVASSVFYYPRWRDGLFCNAAENRFRQHPLDYIEGLEYTIKNDQLNYKFNNIVPGFTPSGTRFASN